MVVLRQFLLLCCQLVLHHLRQRPHPILNTSFDNYNINIKNIPANYNLLYNRQYPCRDIGDINDNSGIIFLFCKDFHSFTSLIFQNFHDLLNASCVPAFCIKHSKHFFLKPLNEKNGLTYSSVRKATRLPQRRTASGFSHFGVNYFLSRLL